MAGEARERCPGNTGVGTAETCIPFVTQTGARGVIRRPALPETRPPRPLRGRAGPPPGTAPLVPAIPREGISEKMKTLGIE